MDIAGQLSKILEELAQKFGVAVDKVYPVLLKQARVELITNIIWFVIFVTVTLICAFLIKRCWNKLISDDGICDEDVYITTFIISMIVASITTILALFRIDDIVQIAINPDWYILNDLIKPLIK